MTDRSDENKKEFSIEELNAWNVEKLWKYLKNRGVVITTDTRKRDLVSKVYHASRLDLPLCSTKEQDDAQIKARRKEKLFIDGISLPLPEKLENWVSGSHNIPNQIRIVSSAPTNFSMIKSLIHQWRQHNLLGRHAQTTGANCEPGRIPAKLNTSCIREFDRLNFESQYTNSKDLLKANPAFSCLRRLVKLSIWMNPN